MHSLQEIKNRLNSISTTRKITKAMQLVASFKLKKAIKNLDSIQEYCIAIEEMFHELNKETSVIKEQFKKNKNGTLHIIINSDIGLCGGYNLNVFKIFKKNYKKNDKVIAIGNKAYAQVKQLDIKLIHIEGFVGDIPNYDAAANVAKFALAELIDGNINKLNIFHTNFVNSIVFEAAKTQMFPLLIDENVKKTKEAIIEYEPSIEIILQKLFPQYIKSMIFRKMVESKVSEISSRRIAMENSTNNAEELIEALNLEYNRVRQSMITKEITEIVAGTNND